MTFDKMSGVVGSLLLVWSRIERAARDEVVRDSGSNPRNLHGVAAVLAAWESKVKTTQPAASLGPCLAKALRAQLQESIEIRNGICHGLIGISAANSGTSATLSWSLNGSDHSITWDELQALLASLSKVPRTISMISDLSRIDHGRLAIDNHKNREWWLQEVGLEL